MKKVFTTKATFDNTQPKVSFVTEDDHLWVFICLNKEKTEDEEGNTQYLYDYAEFIADDGTTKTEVKADPQKYYDLAIAYDGAVVAEDPTNTPTTPSNDGSTLAKVEAILMGREE